MSKKLLITADDFGLSVEVNEAIEIAHCQGVLSTASLMIAGNAAKDAINRAKRLPNLRVGLHLVVMEGNAILPYTEIPDLIDKKGMFPSYPLKMGVNYFFNQKIQQQLKQEIRAQFEAFFQTGLVMDHVDVHKHMHLHPTIGRLLIQIGKEFGIKNIRLPREPIKPLIAAGKMRYKANIGDLLVRYWTTILKKQMMQGSVNSLDWCFGIAWCGHMTFDRIKNLIPHLPEGRSEIFFHPATKKNGVYEQFMPNYQPVEELSALCHPDFTKLLQENNVIPITWNDAE